MDELNPYEATATHVSEQVDVDVRRLIRRGNKMFWAIIAINFSPIAWAVATEQTIASPGMGTFFFLALLYFLWRGQDWARWMMIVIYAALSLLLIVFSVAHFNPFGLIVGSICSVVPILLFTRSMKAWLDYQRFPYDLNET